MSGRAAFSVIALCPICIWAADSVLAPPTSDAVSDHLAAGRSARMAFDRARALHHYSAAFAAAPDDTAVLTEYAALTPDRALEVALLRRLLRLEPAQLAIEEARQRLKFLARLGSRPVYRLESEYLPQEIRMPMAYSRDSRPAGWVLSVRLNQGRPLRLMLDTGSRGLLISRAAARSLELELLGETMLAGFGDNGIRRGERRLASQLEIGGLRWSNIVVESGEVDLPGGFDGLLGLDLFRHFLITLDGPGKVLRLEPFGGVNPAEAEGERPWSNQGSDGDGALLSSGHLLIANTRLRSGAQARFVLDSGAAYSILQRREPAIARRRVSLQGVSGLAAFDEIMQPVPIQIGNFRAGLREAVTTDLSPVSERFGMRIDGFLGFPLLRRLVTTIDLRSGRLQLQ